MRLPKRKNIADISPAYRSPPPYVVISSALAMAVLGVLAIWGSEPFIFPPLGPTLFILFAFPLAQEAHPRNVIGGHLIGLIAGVIALVIFGLVNVPPDLTDLDWSRLGAVLVGMVVSIGLLMGLRVLHIPGVATAMVVAMGLLSAPADWAFMLFGAIVATLVAVGLNRAVGIPHPLWTGPPEQPPAGEK
ncbi:MAG: HPP family protein [Solirubrobacterales bacterium]